MLQLNTVFSFVAANFAILLAAKVGLFKIFMGIALVLGSMKFLVILAWALAIFKYVPDPYIYESHEYQKTPLSFDRNPFDHDPYGQYSHVGHGQYGHGDFGPHDKYGSSFFNLDFPNSLLKFFKLR